MTNINISKKISIVLHCIMRPYTYGRLDRYRIGIPRDFCTQPLLSERSLICDPCHHKDPSFNCATTQFHCQCPSFHIMKDILNPIRSGLFHTVNDPGGGALKAPPPPIRSRKLLCQSLPYHTCAFYQVF